MSTVITETYANGHQRTITVLSLDATDDAGTVIIHTEEDGAIAISAQNKPVLYQQLQQAGLV